MKVPLQPLNLPDFEPVLRDKGQSKQIFDSVRRRFVTLTPEEWVRQHLIHFMVSVYRYPLSLMAVEKAVKVNGLSQRADIVVYNRLGNPWLLAECKAPEVPLTRETFYQAARYNRTLQVPYYFLSNGLSHYCLQYSATGFEFLETLPPFGV